MLFRSNVVEQHVTPLSFPSHEDLHTSLGSFDSCLVHVDDACMNSLDDDSSIMSMSLDLTSSKHDNCDLNDVGTFTYSLSSYNPLEKGCLLNFVDKARLQGMLDLLLENGFLLVEDLFCYISYDIFDWKSRFKNMNEGSPLHMDCFNEGLIQPTLINEDHVKLALSSHTTSLMERPNGDYWLSALKGQHLARFEMPNLNTIFHDIVFPKHVNIDYPCVSLSISLHSYYPLEKGSLFYVVGSFRMHKDYWEKKKAMVELVETPKLEKANLDILGAETNFKKSLELDSSQEELDFFNGKLTKDDIKGLVVRLKMLKRNMEVKGKVLKATMYEPILLVVLARRVQKFLLKLQAHWRARRPKEKKKGATPRNSTLKHSILEKAELLKGNLVKEDHQSSTFEGGRNKFIKGHKSKFFKENFKPP